VLQGKLVLHDLRDTEALAMRIVERSGFVLSYAEREELATYLIEVAWEISTVWKPGAASFSTYATTTLRRRAIDWRRTPTLCCSVSTMEPTMATSSTSPATSKK